MTKMKQLFIACLSLFAAVNVHGQTSPSEILADKIAQKMKDSLLLSDVQKSQLYQINLDLHTRKLSVWQQYSDVDSVQVHLQRLENTRDSLYKPILSDDQFLLYSQKKKNLISNN